MPFIQFSDKDLLRGKLVTPAWYLVHIDAVGEKLSKDGGSTNYPVEGTIVRNADDGSEEFANVPVDWNFNSKAMGFAKGFLNSLGQDNLESNKRYDLNAAAGQMIEMFIENKLYEGRTINTVNHKYRAVRTN